LLGAPVNKAAQQLGKLAKGVPKVLTAAQREQRRRQLAVARQNRWPKKGQR
jgi:hypothetical protein